MEDTRIVSDDAAALHRTMGLLYPGAIESRVPAGRAHFEWRSLRTEDVTIVETATTMPLHLDMRLEPLWAVARVDGAGVRLILGDDVVDTRSATLIPPDPLRLEWREVSVRSATFDGARAERMARLQAGDDALILRPLGPRALSAMHEEYWWTAWRRCRDALAVLAERDEPLAEAQVRSTLTAAALYAFPTTLSEHPSHGRQDSTPERRVRRALAFIDDNAHRPIDTLDIAAGVGMSGRGLRAAFLRAGLAAPERHLRRARLTAIRRDLRASAPEETTLEIAQRWGFPRAGRFRRLYRAEFGVDPEADRPAAPEVRDRPPGDSRASDTGASTEP